MWPDKRIIDLTLPLRSGMRGVNIEPACTVAEQGWNASTYHLYSHAATHMDAPLHFGVNNRTIDDIPLDRCLCPVWIADVSPVEPKALITVGDLGTIPERIQPGEGLLLKTGWSQRLGEPDYYNALPRVSEELALWCAGRALPLLGVEPPSVADPLDLEEVTRIHRILLGADVVIVEGLTNLEALRRERVLFGALPLKVAGGDGAPVRAFAVEE